jgi:hypothetical protein
LHVAVGILLLLEALEGGFDLDKESTVLLQSAFI